MSQIFAIFVITISRGIEPFQYPRDADK